jgi:protein-ribulosamine 3-kinase
MKWKPLLAHVFPDEQILSTQPLSGGDINWCYKIVTSRQAYFVKFNNVRRFRRMYECEAAGLHALAATKAVNIPKVLKYGDVEDMTYLVLEYIEPAKSTTKALASLGHDLAMLHKQPQEHFGWEQDNYIGSLLQQNNWWNDWQTFYSTQRILPLCEKLTTTKAFSQLDVDQAKRYLDKHNESIPTGLPSLIHGDLWSGNFLIGNNDKPYLIDPACYYGHREMDIAMTQLFGGFGNNFIQAYSETYPLQEGWQQRVPYFQLYPLLVHAVIFGGGYIDKIRNVIHQGVR